MMLCPRCSHNLTPLTIDTSSLGKMEIDHCYFCGGVFLDHYEINRIPFKNGLPLSKMASSEQLKGIKPTNLCPRDGKKMIQLRSDSIPPQTVVLSCPLCRGNFITQNDLVDLKKAQKVKLDYYKTWKIPLPALSSVIIPSLFLFIGAAGVYLTVQNVRQNQEARVKAQETISVPTIIISENNSVLISYTTSVPALSSLAYLKEGDKEPHTIPVSTDKEKVHTVILTNLEEKSKYSFKIYVEEIPGEILSSPNYNFATN